MGRMKDWRNRRMRMKKIRDKRLHLPHLQVHSGPGSPTYGPVKAASPKPRDSKPTSSAQSRGNSSYVETQSKAWYCFSGISSPSELRGRWNHIPFLERQRCREPPGSQSETREHRLSNLSLPFRHNLYDVLKEHTGCEKWSRWIRESAWVQHS